ncbi:RluA family pseudouridine synthase [Desulfovibrio sp. OttesenSCG-928-C14]|nr:RluA family pseudouridine synthase [Desulfovibrio sp. OttesenSCG-928-C14]
MPLILKIESADSGLKLLRFLDRRTNLPRPHLHRLLRTGQIRLNGGRTDGSALLKAGDEVRLPPFLAGPEQAGGPGALPPGPVPNPAAPASEKAPPGLPGKASAAGIPPASSTSTLHGNIPSNPVPDRQALEKALGPGLRVIHLDENFLALDKAPGLPTQPGSGQADSVSARLKAAFAGSGHAPAPAHRLDKDASGLLLAGLHGAAQRYLHSLFREEKPDLERAYLAWADGKWALPGQSLLEDLLCLECDEKGREKMRAWPGQDSAHRAGPLPGPISQWPGARAPKSGAGRPGYPAAPPPLKLRPASGVFTCLKQVDLGGGRWASLLKVVLLSGRKHQIRVQCASRGHPLIGDRKYGGPPHPGLLLHACSIKIPACPDFHGLAFPGLAFSSSPHWDGDFAIFPAD